MHYFTVYFYYSTTTPAVCISKTELRPLSQELLFYFSSILPISRLYYCTICRFTIYYFTVYSLLLLFYHAPSRLHLENRTVPFEPGFTILLIIHYFTTILLYFLLVDCLRCYYLLLYCFTAPPAVCISKTELRRLSQDFAVLLFYKFI